MENILVPDQSVASIPCQRALVFAPHPDDEVFGCGGAIMRHIEQGAAVCVIIVSNGAYGVSEDQTAAYTSQRRQESIAAARILGYGSPVFWQYRDRQIRYDEKLIQEVSAAIRETDADLVYAPSVFEMHPDHRMLAMAVIEAVRRIGKHIRIALYEVGVPLHPNLLLDITGLMPRKNAAMECFVSQNAKQRYDLHIASLNRYRTYTLPAHVTAAEAFNLIPAEELANDPLNLYRSEHSRQKALGLPLDNSDLPLVSVIIRSMDRDTLPDALDSVALQTYPNIEVVIVNAKGAGHRAVGAWCGRFSMRIIGDNRPLNRSCAANAGLLAAHGTYLIFLDDDDLFYPEHIATLVAALQSHTSTKCAYAGVKVEYYENDRLETFTEFNEPFDRFRLWGRNFIPIHAMLFEKSLVGADQCHFDETLEVFEDWDFWIQLSQCSQIIHVNKITAIYRNFGRSNLGYKQDENFVREARSKIYEKWKKIFSGTQLEDLIQYRENAIINLRAQVVSSEQLIASLQDRIQQEALSYAQREQLSQQAISNSSRTIHDLNKTIHDLNKTIHDLNKTIHDLSKTVDDIFHSTSWRMTAPLRFFVRIARGRYREAWESLRRRILPLLKRIYWRLPVRWRDKILTAAYRIAGALFVGTGHYEAWRIAQGCCEANQLPTGYKDFFAGMIDLAAVPSLTTAPGRIAIHAHIFYADLASEFASFIQNMPFPYDLFVSTTSESARQTCQKAFSRLPQLKQLTIAIVPNRGRDIAPMFCTFGKELEQYDFIAHIHSKKSLYNLGATDGWREYLLNCLLGSKSQIQKIFTLLSGEKDIGIVYPQNYHKLPYAAYTWLSNQALGLLWCNRLNITRMPRGYFDFPAGSMFWIRAEALKPLFDARFTLDDFPEEAGQTDATLAHCLERLLVLVTQRSGYNAIVLRDTQSNSWSRWHFEQYLSRSREDLHLVLINPDVRIVVFDIFDTLLTRPLLNPEIIKNIVAEKIGGKVGDLYLEFRATAESQARQKAGRDIGMDTIFSELIAMSGLSSEIAQQLRNLEETIEMEMVTPRPEVVELLQTAVSLGKRVVLASDMYLPKSLIEMMLQRNGIYGWHKFYLSSENGFRKDTGDFYRQLLLQENVSPNEILIIGDNEHSDLQIPTNLGIDKCIHTMRSVELARAMPRLEPIIQRISYSDDLNSQLTLGMIVQRNFHQLTFPKFDPFDFVPSTPWAIGYTIAGPIILSFVQWLAKQAAIDKIQCLYFLAREGQILKMVYDQWTSNNKNAIPSNYLILSRRAVSVSMISNLEDIFQIARTQSSPTQLIDFIRERYGLQLSVDEYENLIRERLWSRDKLIVVKNENIDHLKPVLKALEARILANAQNERPGLLAYLDKVGLNVDAKFAIVDIGYSATIQGYLNRIINHPVHGYYMMTIKQAQKISSQYGAITQGYFCHHINPDVDKSAIFVKSFTLEKLLSSDDAQIVCYRRTESGDIVPQFRQLDDKERQSTLTRAEIRRGIMDFVSESIMIRDKIIDTFEVPPDIATTLFDEFVRHPSRSEKEILSSLVLDDYYCGRGLVS